MLNWFSGFVTGRERKLGENAHWRGNVDAKLDNITGSVSILPALSKEVTENTEATKSAHKSIDRIESHLHIK